MNKYNLSISVLTQGTYFLDVYCDMNSIGSYSLSAQNLGPVDDFSSDTNTTGSLLEVGGSVNGTLEVEW